MSGMFDAAAEASKKNLNETEKKLMTTETTKEDRTTLCLSILKSDKKKLKQKSVDEGKTIAALIHEWLNS